MPNRNQTNKKLQKIIAKRRIDNLFCLAEQKAQLNDLNLANRYVELARKISMRSLTPIPRELKRHFCNHCHCYLLPNINCRIRIHRGKIIIYCHNCKKYTRIPL